MNTTRISLEPQQVINRTQYHTPQVIGLTGCAYAGKSTVASILSLIYKYEKVSFADPLKRMLLTIGVPPESLYGDKGQKEAIIPRFGKSGRYMMQSLGTEWGRDLVDINLWVNLCREKIESLVAQEKYVVIDDVRFASELSMINSLSGCVYRIISFEGYESRGKGTHASENNLDRFDCLPDIYNTEDQYSLYDKLYNSGKPNMHRGVYEAYIDNCNKLLTAEPK